MFYKFKEITELLTIQFLPYFGPKVLMRGLLNYFESGITLQIGSRNINNILIMLAFFPLQKIEVYISCSFNNRAR